MEDDLSSLFGGGESNPIEILLEMLNQDNIVIKSQVTMKQIRSLLKIKWEAEKTKEKNKEKMPIQIIQDEIVPYYLALKCSYLRKSRTEILDTLKKMDDKMMPVQAGLISPIGVTK